MINLPRLDPKTERFIALHALLKANFFLEIKGAEVGVRNGQTAKFLLDNNPYLFLYLIDSYPPYQDIHDYLTSDLQESIMKKTLESFREFERAKRIEWFLVDSLVAAREIADDSLDFVFIDALHTTDAVLADCIGWYRKVRKGGILCGHDYCYDPVKRGVKMFGKPTLSLTCEGDIWIIERE